MKSRGSNAPK